MSLNAGEPAFRGILLFFEFVREGKPRWESGNPAFGFPLFLAAVAGAVGMWESRFLRFPRAVGKEGNLLLVFLFFHGPSFPQPCLPLFFMPSVFAQIPQTASVFLSASWSHSLCRSRRLLSGSSSPPSAPALNAAPGPAVAAGSPTASHTSDRFFSACPWRWSPLPAPRMAGESSSRD